MDKKIKLKIPKIEINEIEINGQKIKIKNQIAVEDIQRIIIDIQTNIFENNEIIDKAILMHIRMIQDIVEICTNIDTEELNEDELNSWFLYNLLFENIENLYILEDILNDEYKKWILENSLGILGTKMPNSKELEKTIESLKEMIDNIPQEKLETIAKTIVWNNMPTLGQAIAPASKE